MKRREFIKAGVFAAIGAAGCTGSRGFVAPCVGEAYAGWRTGELDIHFINTGVGEQTFFIFPDGTTMLLDCGDHYRHKIADEVVPRRPSPERLGGECVRRVSDPNAANLRLI